ncbi:MAG: hypothetical protein KAH32_02110 [Chlamydiia bacterium]|nr:hypothetical protein [Chlamydiia bacterium]
MSTSNIGPNLGQHSSTTDSFSEYKKNIEEFENAIAAKNIFSQDEINTINSNPNQMMYESITGIKEFLINNIIPKPDFNVYPTSSPLNDSNMILNLISSLSDALSHPNANKFSISHKTMDNMLQYAKKLHNTAVTSEVIKAKIIGSSR